MKLFAAVTLFLCVFCSCAAHPIRSLAPIERSRWSRCQPAIDIMCGGNGFCGIEMMDQYAALPDEDTRKMWLVANGCPVSVVDPARALGLVRPPSQAGSP